MASVVHPSYPEAATDKPLPATKAPTAMVLNLHSLLSQQPFGSRNGLVILSLIPDPFHLINIMLIISSVLEQ